MLMSSSSQVMTFFLGIEQYQINSNDFDSFIECFVDRQITPSQAVSL
jgi:hypothetical protein